MLLTEPAYREMEMQSGRLGCRLRSLLRRLQGRAVESTRPDVPSLRRPTHTSQLHVVARSDVIHEPPAGDSDVIQREFRWRRHPLLRVQTGAEDDAASMTLDLRTARSAAVRGIFFARSRRFSKAEASFADAAVHPQINLTAIPGFWDLSRAGMDAAICAYEANGRYRDAAALTARIRVMYRPTAVTPLPPLNENRRSASGS